MTNEAAAILEQLTVLEVEINARVLVRAALLGELAKCYDALKTRCGYSPGSESARKWDELEKAGCDGTLLAILDFLAQSGKTIPEFVEAWDVHGDIRLALCVLARSTSAAASRFHPSNN